MTYMPPPYEHPFRRRRRLDRPLLVNAALGMGLGAAGALALLAFDTLGLSTRLFASDPAWLGAAAFVILFALTSGVVVAVCAAMRADDDDEPGGGLRAPALAYAPVRAR